jgi:hypothetical protein
MKKIGLVLLLIASIWFVSCDERYEEKRDLVFEGTWTLDESYVDSVLVYRNPKGSPDSVWKFITARKFGGENLLLFYSGGRYDSSIFYRIQDNHLFVRRVEDSVYVIEYYMKDSRGDTIKYYVAEDTAWYPRIYRSVEEDKSASQWNLDTSREEILVIDIIGEVQKPIYPQTNLSEESYYGTYHFDGVQKKMFIDRYAYDKVNNAPIVTTVPPKRDIYERPVERE